METTHRPAVKTPADVALTHGFLESEYQSQLLDVSLNTD